MIQNLIRCLLSFILLSWLGVGLGGCVPTLDASEAGCPCREKWKCCDDLDICVPEGDSCAKNGPSTCGNGNAEDGEGCDDGNGVLTDECPDGPDGICQRATCGDGFVYDGEEACDGGDVDNGICGENCSIVCNSGYADCNDRSSDGCEANLKSDASTCGACDNFCEAGWICNNGYCIQILAEGQKRPSSIAVDAAHVYWTSLGSRDQLGNYNADGNVARAPLDGGDMTVLADDQRLPRDIVVDAIDVYWVNDTHAGMSDGAIMKAPKTGGPAKPLEENVISPRHLVDDDAHVYWVLYGDSSSDVMRAPKDGSAVPMLVTSRGEGINALVASAGGLYWVEDYKRIFRSTVAGGTATELHEFSFSQGLATDGEFLYWVGSFVGNEMVKLPIAGGFRTILGAQPESCSVPPACPYRYLGTAMDAFHVYWIRSRTGEQGSGYDVALLRSPIEPGATEEILTLTAIGAPTAVAVDDDYVYWTTRGSDGPPTGAVMRAQK